MAHVTRTGKSRSDILRKWTIADSMELYNVQQWGLGFFGVNEDGHMTVMPGGEPDVAVDLKALVDELRQRGIGLPLLIRFSDILRTRIEQMNAAFGRAIDDHDYQGAYRGVYPVKVNQQRHVVEEIVAFGGAHGFGLEAGSKPELLAVLALLESPEALVICNGYKDADYIDMALLGMKLGKTMIIVVEEFRELELVLRRSIALGVRPRLGFRLKLTARGSGRWQESGGSRSKFGLTVTEVLRAVELLRSEGMLDCLTLTHFHLGSQVTNIRSIKEALAEGSRMFVELTKLGAVLKYFDVGGGMAVDYDGSSSNFASSANYSLQEYASDVVAAISEACEESGVAHPTIVNECGRALTAHHSALIFDILGVTRMTSARPPESLPEDAHTVLHNLLEAHQSVTAKNFQESYHDVVHLREEALSLFKLGYLTLADCGIVEALFWSACRKISRVMATRDYVPDEMDGLEAQLADTYVANMSVFQSLPDAWAVGQLFPVMPIHRLDEEPTCRGTLADITCDSDGKVDKFIDLRDVKSTLELHPFDGGEYQLGVFLVGAYQETLGDMHNLFGDPNVVHVSVTGDGEYFVDHVVSGDTVEEVLHYVQYSSEDLSARLRRTVEAAVRQKRMTFGESAEFLARYERGLKGHTYLNS